MLARRHVQIGDTKDHGNVVAANRPCNRQIRFCFDVAERRSRDALGTQERTNSGSGGKSTMQQTDSFLLRCCGLTIVWTNSGSFQQGVTGKTCRPARSGGSRSTSHFFPQSRESIATVRRMTSGTPIDIGVAMCHCSAERPHGRQDGFEILVWPIL